MNNKIIYSLVIVIVSVLLVMQQGGCGSSSSGGGEATTTTSLAATSTTTTTTSTSTVSTSASTTTTTLPSYLHAYFDPQTYAPACLAMFYRNPPTLVGNYIYIGTSRPESRYAIREDWNDNYLFKLDKNLNLIWAYFLGDDEVKGGVIPDNEENVYFVAVRHPTYHRLLYKITSQGTKEWEVDMGSGGSNFGTETPAITTNEVIYASGDVLKAYDTNGNVVWALGFGTSSPLALDSSGNLYFTQSGRLYSYTSAGVERWFTVLDPGGESVSGPALSTNEAYVYAAIKSYIGCFNTSDGALNWIFSAEADPYFRACPAVDENNNVYLGTKNGSASIFYALNADGTLKWQKATGVDLYSSPTIANNGYLYLGSEGSRLQSFNKETGADHSGYPLGVPHGADVTYSSPLLDSTGIFYIGNMAQQTTEAGMVLAIITDSTGLSTTAAWPRFHGGNSGTGRK